MSETRLAPRALLQPRCTLVPNFVLDGVMAHTTGGEWKAMCYLYRVLGREGPEGYADLDEIAFATGVEEEDMAADLEELRRQGFVRSHVLESDVEVFRLALEEEDV